MTTTLVTLLLLLGSVACDVTGQVCFKLGVGHEAVGAGAPSLAYKVFHSPWIALGVPKSPYEWPPGPLTVMRQR